MTAAEELPVRLEHHAFFYGSDAQYADSLTPLLAGAVAAGHEVCAVVPARNAAALQHALGSTADGVRWIDAGTWYRHPVRTIAGYDALLRTLRSETPAFVIGEVEFGGSAAEWRAWTCYESALNRVLERYPARVICPYDERTLPPAVVADAERTHPHLLRAGVIPEPSARYREPEALLRSLAPAVEQPDAPPRVELAPVRSVRTGRRAFADVARECGMPDERVDELVVAVSEVLTNAAIHAEGTTTMRVWADERSILCVIEDAGAGADDPLLGLRPPPPDAPSGYGLWYARQVFDRSEIGRSPLGGLLVSLVADLGNRSAR